jgi:hypothetical protein
MNGDRIALAAAAVAVAAGLIGGFAVMGSPGHARAVHLDNRRIADVKAIAGRIEATYGRQGRASRPLPQRLPANLVVPRGDGTDATADPVTGRPYAYARLGGDRYRLCVTFATAVSPGDADPTAWAHPGGPVCYRLTAGEQLSPWQAPPPETETPAPRPR